MARRIRRLVVDEHTYRWSVGHRHRQPGPTYCTEVLTLGRDGAHGRVRLVFVAGPDYGVQDGWLHDGAVMRYADGACLNLHRPGTARAFLDEVLSAGEDFSRDTEVDGWPYFGPVVVRQREVGEGDARPAELGE